MIPERIFERYAEQLLTDRISRAKRVHAARHKNSIISNTPTDVGTGNLCRAYFYGAVFTEEQKEYVLRMATNDWVGWIEPDHERSEDDAV